MRHRFARILGVLFLGLLAILFLQYELQSPKGILPQVQKHIQQKITGTGILHRLFLDNDLAYAASFLPKVYASRNYSPVWFSASGILPQAHEFILELTKAETEGLTSDDYHLKKIERLYEKANQKPSTLTLVQQQQFADLDLLLTDAFLLYASHLLNGRVSPETIDPNWEIKPAQVDLLQILNQALGAGGIKQTLQGLLPKDLGYGRLKQVLFDYQRYANQGLVYAPGDNVKLSDRIWQMKANLERWRWLPQDFGSRFVLVNIASFELIVVENQRAIMSMKVIVGRDFRETPVFSSRMNEIILNPYWEIPHTLAVRDVLPVLQSNPQYLIEKKIRVFESWEVNAREVDSDSIRWNQIVSANFAYHLRQDPGMQNPLGRILFQFPNPYAVYLHDTPDKYLFNVSARTYSSGCIRIEKPIQLASYLLKNQGWTAESLLNELNNNQEKRLNVSIPVYILYWTAWVAPNGKPHFVSDVYKRDERLIEALQKKPPG